jgi:hypothetical protein
MTEDFPGSQGSKAYVFKIGSLEGDDHCTRKLLTAPKSQQIEAP